MSVTSKPEMRTFAKLQGFKYGGYADGHHMFHRPAGDKFENVLATQADVENGNAVWLLANGFTR